MSADRPRVYLLDVEGTIAPISFVYEQLFPYARAHFHSFLDSNMFDANVGEDLLLLAEENRSEGDADAPHMKGPGDPDGVLYLHWLMDRDRKSTALKSLQGKVWKAGFESGALKGILFDDVPATLARWSGQAQAAIYSSGSVEAQRLLLRYSTFGDLTGRIAAYFDTRTGAKTDAASYAAIARAMQVEAGAIRFYSDVVRELDPAREVGCQTRLVVREGNAPVAEAHGHRVIDTLDGEL